MEPITLILAAIAAGAASGFQDTTSDAVKDAYAALKGALLAHFNGNPKVSAALEQAEPRVNAYNQSLEDILRNSDIGQESEIIQAAQQLMDLLESRTAQDDKYNFNFNGNVQGVATGDRQIVKMEFGTES